MTDEPSPKYTWNKTDLWKIIKGGIIAFAGAFCYSVLVWLQAYFAQGVVTWATFVQPFITVCIPAAMSVGINAILKFIDGQPKA